MICARDRRTGTGNRRRGRGHVAGLHQPSLESSAARIDGCRECSGHPHGIAGFGYRSIQQHGVKTHFHRLGGVARRADPGIDDEGHAWEIGPHGLQTEAIVETAARADGRTPRHQHLATGGEQTIGGAKILGRVGKHLEAVAGQRAGRLDEPKQIRLQRVVIGDDFELHPIGAEHLARHLGGGDRFLGRATAGCIRQTATPSAWISSMNFSPVRPRADLRRSDTVTMPASDAFTASASTAGDGYWAVPSSSREARLVP